ncbi:hypothetical protein ACFFOS_02850 [Nocardioides kongjuensis]|uniref:Uncharacterized protein n=1 Tax=Nocardioides kongjuensis TaxID=349522 RepID=A0A852R546_9ACTN|nr:hypothetical protein [Nocardioides kongjuensis]NYD28711.1 hypothetical protein [Nocardioides kongjuensis]
MEPEILADSAREPSQLREELHTCRLELAALREQQEIDRELLATAARAEEQLIKLSLAVDTWLTKRERRSRWWGPLRRWLAPEMPTRSERADLALITSSNLFDGAWYLRTYPAAAGSGATPALHYLRRGAWSGKDPGPDFDTRAYRRQHPELGAEVNPLLHHLRSQR